MQAVLISQYEDETDALTQILNKNGFVLRVLKDLPKDDSVWSDQPLDLILIAIDQPGDQYPKAIRQIRMYSAAPLLLISDPLDESDQVGLLEAGIDYLVTRPFGIRFLRAVIISLARRTKGTSLFNLPDLTQGELTLDQTNRSVIVEKNQPIRLTQLEFRLLHTLITHPGQVIPTDNLVEYVWGYSGDSDRDLVRGLVQRLRTKIEPDPRNPRYIITHSGLGYSFEKKEKNQ